MIVLHANYAPDARKWWTLAAVVGMASWFFGNAYEAVVLSPNWVVDTPIQMEHLKAFFRYTSPSVYFVPLLIATDLLVFVLWLRDKALFRKSALMILILNVMNAVTVVGVVLPLFGPDGNEAYAWTWNVLNAVRMVLTAATGVLLFRVFLRQDGSGEVRSSHVRRS